MQAGAAPAANAPKSETVSGGKETILVVEDEINLLELVRSVLERYQYRVLIAASGAEALRVWEEQRGQIDLLMTDMIMPGGMTGSELAEELKKRKPGLKVIFTSGYSAELAGKDFSHDGTNFLPKPYQPQMVAQLVRKMLDAPAGWRLPGAAHPAPPAGAQLIARPPAAPLVQETRTASGPAYEL